MVRPPVTSTFFQVNWVEEFFAAWLFCPPKLHLLVLSRCKFGRMITLPTKVTFTCFPSKTSRCYFCRKRCCQCFLMLTLVYVQNKMYVVPTWKNNRITNFSNWNSNLMSFQQQISQKMNQPEYLESEMKFEFCYQWWSQKSKPKIGIPNLGHILCIVCILEMSWFSCRGKTHCTLKCKA